MNSNKKISNAFKRNIKCIQMKYPDKPTSPALLRSFKNRLLHTWESREDMSGINKLKCGFILRLNI